MLAFLVRYGGAFAVGLSLLVALCGIAAAAAGAGALAAVAGVALGGVAYVLLRSYVELVRVIVDMLLPK